MATFKIYLSKSWQLVQILFSKPWQVFFFFFELLKTLKYMASLHYYLSGGNAFSSVANKCLVGAEQREQLNAAQWVEFAKSYVKPAWVFANPALVEAWALDRSRTAARH